MRITRLSILVCIFIILSSCSNIVYQNAVPKNSDICQEFSSDIIGNYIDIEGDTLSISAHKYSYGNKNDMLFISGKLNEDLVLKKYSDYYFLNFKNDEGFWEMLAAKPYEKHLVIYCIDASNRQQLKIVNSLLSKNKAKSIKKNGKYIINPEDDEVIELLEKNDVCKTTQLTKIR